MLHSHPGLCAGAAVFPSFNDHSSVPVPRHNGISHNEVLRARWGIRPKLRHHKPTFFKAAPESFIRRWVVLRNARANYRNSAPTCI